jgi:hypothetical protein
MVFKIIVNFSKKRQLLVKFASAICATSQTRGHLKGQCHEIFCYRFFHESPSPKPLIITVGSFRMFSKIRGINDTGGKFATGINDTGGKFCHQFPLCC